MILQGSSTVATFVAYFSDLMPTGDKVAVMRNMLELSRTVDVARLAIDSDGDVALLYEVPAIDADTLGQVEAQFTLLLIEMAMGHSRS